MEMRRLPYEDLSLSQEVGNLVVRNLVTIEEHQAGKLGVLQLYYLYILAKGHISLRYW